MIRRERKCERCDGRGWVESRYAMRIDDWAIPCPKCGGRSKFRTVQLAKLLKVHRRDLYRVDTLTAGSRVGARVLDAIAREFPELFA